MKKKSILIILLMIIGGGLYYFNNQKPLEKTIQKSKLSKKKDIEFIIVKNHLIENTRKIKGKIISPEKLIKTSKISGKIDFIKSGEFKKGDLLLRFDNSILFEQLASFKKTLNIRLTHFISDLDSNIKEKWIGINSQINPEKVLIPFPENLSNNELNLLKKHNCISLYNSLIDLESEMESFFILAEFDGEISNTKFRKGNIVLKDDTLFLLKDKKPILFKIENDTRFSTSKNIEIIVYNKNNENIGTAIFSKSNTKFIYYELKPTNKFNDALLNDSFFTYFKITSKIPYFKLPKHLLRVDSNITLTNNKKIKLHVLKEEHDFYVVRGLNDGDSIKIEQ